MATTSPGDLQDVLSGILARLRKLETAQVLTVSNYKISQDSRGNLIATYVPDGTVTVLVSAP
jgi:hypothetical protein